MGFTTIDYLVLFVYLLITVLLGILLRKRSQTLSDYFLAGRRLPSRSPEIFLGCFFAAAPAVWVSNYGRARPEKILGVFSRREAPEKKLGVFSGAKIVFSGKI